MTMRKLPFVEGLQCAVSASDGEKHRIYSAFQRKIMNSTNLGTSNAGFAAMVRTMRGLSNAEDLPV
jgi:hypothetical protein